MTKRNKIIIGVSVIVLAVLIFGIWQWKQAKKIHPQPTASIEYKDLKSDNAEAYAQWQTYANKKYAYQVKYPADWHVFSDEAEADFSDQDLGDGQTVQQGGSVFFSNQDNIDYIESTKPADFHLLGLMIYAKPNMATDDFAKLLGFTEATGTQGMVFQADNIVGKEYVSVGATDSDPRVAIIFKNNDRFYVFHLEFTGSDPETLKNMEAIVGTLQVGN